ncbi:MULTISPECIES: hypothetical protein [Rhizobium]|uniref:hypothetical protein n=2 Tax=Rhizobium/Agrobacterium group TaxID=227290 RepID=UPI0013BCD2C9|nr:hypothetical protein [Rhizobium leguminosarum]MBY5384738.1 hypothetical protein [Rhizobium leguminosarum]MBY5426461.1 hypothetical protein [Rhizobium leguminosarum]MCA2435485.1 hypothetical protein [Rhizobium leguminosarum]NEH45717.1 hypothetical protein [Rhizobium leguminosarum]NEH70729.1 hypothetical protein [Rhizobium leguminosarum]
MAVLFLAAIGALKEVMFAMNAIHTRTAEALLTAAGSPPPYHSDGDFRLDRSTDDQWRIVILSARARAWVHEQFCFPLCQCLGDSIAVDMLSADRFLKIAHDQGFRTEFVGRSGKDLY